MRKSLMLQLLDLSVSGKLEGEAIDAAMVPRKKSERYLSTYFSDARVKSYLNWLRSMIDTAR